MTLRNQQEIRVPCSSVAIPPMDVGAEVYGPCRDILLQHRLPTHEAKVIVVDSPLEMAKVGAQEVRALVNENPQAVLGLATGSTMQAFYAELVKYFHAGTLSLNRVTTFNLDEYYPIGDGAQGSYRREMLTKFFQHVDLTLTPAEGARWGQTHVPSTNSENIAQFCLAYEQAIIRNGGINLQMLGIGRNGHIGFNEPGTSLWSRTRVVKLTQETREDNAVHFGSLELVPEYAITMGILTILEAQKIVLMACGEKKAEAVAAALRMPYNPKVPASALQFHPNVTFVLDSAAASRL
jgi:glucosamine-6-phosphate deaminase